jgi:DNA-binding NarL/FixJ family response regulator
MLGTLYDVVVIKARPALGLLAARAIRAREPLAKIVAAGVPRNERDIADWAAAGAIGCVSAADGFAELIRTIEVTASGQASCSPSIGAELFWRARNRAASPRPESQAESPLTARELDVLRLVEYGLTNKQIAAALQVQVATVKNHIHRILSKLDVHHRAAAVDWARERGLLPAADVPLARRSSASRR